MLTEKSTDKIMRNKIAAVVILYYPPDSVISNIQSYLSDVEVLYVFDNSPDINQSLVEVVMCLDKVKYLTVGSNIGIAAALNIVAGKVIDEGYEYLLTMDQDSASDKNMIGTMLDIVSRDPSIGLITPFHVDRNTAKKSHPSEDVEKILTAMTSGNLIRLSAYQQVGGFQEKLFIDYVDTEYCLQLHMHGFSVVRANRAILSHSVGNYIPCRYFGRTVYPANHNPARHYYQTRNRFYLRHLYGRKYPEYFKSDTKLFWTGLLKIILYEKQCPQKLYMIFRGLLAYWFDDFSSIPML